VNAPDRAPAWPIYRRLLTYARPYRGLLFVALIGMLIEAGAAGAFTLMMKPVVDGTFIDRDPELIRIMPWVIVAIFAVRGLAGYLSDVFMARAARSLSRDMRVRVFGKYLRLPGLYFDREPVADMQVRLSSDSEQVAQAAIDAAKVMLQQSFQVVALLAVMLYTSWRVTIAILLIAPLLAWIMDRVGKRYRRYGHRIQESSGRLLQAADQALNNQQEVKVYGAQDDELQRYRGLADETRTLAIKVESTRSITSAAIQLMGSVALALLLFLAGREAVQGRLTAGDFISLMTSMLGIIPALKQLTNVQNMLQKGVASAERLFSILDRDEERDTGTRALAKARGELEFRAVDARYPGQTPSSAVPAAENRA
jgi:ATP-binding cassette, subfamily B, bacterial MsbA